MLYMHTLTLLLLLATGWLGAVLPDPRKLSRPILPKTTAGLGPFTASKIFLHCRFHGRFYLQLFYEKRNKCLNTNTQFSTARFIFILPVFSYSAVATAILESQLRQRSAGWSLEQYCPSTHTHRAWVCVCGGGGEKEWIMTIYSGIWPTSASCVLND